MPANIRGHRTKGPLPIIGQIISHYRIVEKLGGGGMGVGYKAEDTRLQRLLARKATPQPYPNDQHAIELDPNFAMGYRAVGDDYWSMEQLGRASEYYTKAFQLREHASERGKSWRSQPTTLRM